MAKVCKECGTVAEPASVTKGTMGIDIVLWLCFLVPGLIYSLWRLSTRHDACAACGSAQLVPVHSPLGQQLAAQYPTAPAPAEPARRPSSAAVSMGRSLGRLFAKKKSAK